MDDIDIITIALRNLAANTPSADPRLAWLREGFAALADEIDRVEEDATENGPDIFSGRVEERQQ